MLKLYSFGPKFGVADPSPFVLKVDAWLRLAAIPFESVADMNNLRKAPKGKLPFIEDGDNQIADSEFIIEYLQQHYDCELDDWLDQRERALAYHIGKSLDENLYWCLVYSRWIRDEGWVVTREAFFGSMPFPIKQLVPVLARGGVKSALKKQGLGLHEESEIITIMQRSLQALSTLLADQRYIFGDRPCSLDATAFGLLAQFMITNCDDEFSRAARQHSNLLDYCQRLQTKLYSDN